MHIGVPIIRIFSIVISILLLVLMFRSELYLRQSTSRILCSLLTLTVSFACEYTLAIYAVVQTNQEEQQEEQREQQLLQRIRPTYFLILSNHVFLPYAKSRHAFYGTGTIIAIETALTIYSRLKSNCIG